MTIYSAAKPSLIKGMMELAVLGIIYVVSCHYHVWKQCQAYWLRRQQSTKKKEPLLHVPPSRVVVITGCDRGFGRMLAEQLTEGNHQHDFIVVALALTAEAVSELQAHFAQCSHQQNKHLALQCNVTDEVQIAQMKQAVEQILLQTEQNTNNILYAVVNNAGIADPGDFVFDPTLQAYQNVMNVNFFGMLRITQTLLPIMLQSSRDQVGGGARILNMSSVCGAVATPGNAAYNASKFAVEAWSHALRTELAPFHIAVSMVRPGQVRTQIQLDWQTNYVKNFDAAPANIQALYGGPAFRRQVLDTFQIINDKSGMLGDPAVVVETLKDMLTMPQHKLQPYYWVGSDANTLWRAFSLLPLVVSDTLKRNFFYFAPVETPDSLQKLKGQ